MVTQVSCHTAQPHLKATHQRMHAPAYPGYLCGLQVLYLYDFVAILKDYRVCFDVALHTDFTHANASF